MSSERNDETIDLRGVGNVAVDSGLPGGAALTALTDAAVLRDDDEMGIARAAAVAELGADTTARALAVAGNFEMMNRLLDAIGVGPTPAMSGIGDDLAIPLPDRWR